MIFYRNATDRVGKVYSHRTWTDELRGDMLSLYDKSNLKEVSENADEICVSIGCFYQRRKHGKVVEMGKTIPSIKWITPDDILKIENW
ncbi:MAG: hypothetical protein IJF07_09035 [Lachnospiraceae bacterium]|nr:hypothetical protein [Lachnospiraceae bacterium]